MPLKPEILSGEIAWGIGEVAEGVVKPNKMSVGAKATL